jgi:predicted negative regulator of RcsB-dependent stress response
MDRAQRMRAQRMWWERNGAFFRGFLLGVVITAVIMWAVWRFVR